ncbi:hypothetical protein, partial [Falsiruegeria litorea]|uniref:hypothetical protein n=1 Tax=Falsiruegeria litorea TaxID=1280831 RepID=UPI003EB8479F|nr:IS5/IS1182 family transposase [Falsiruegeria litorea]
HNEMARNLVFKHISSDKHVTRTYRRRVETKIGCRKLLGHSLIMGGFSRQFDKTQARITVLNC